MPTPPVQPEAKFATTAPEMRGFVFPGVLEDGEIIILATRPSLWFIVLKRLGSLLLVLLVSLLAIIVDVKDLLNISAPAILSANALGAALVMAWFAIDRATRLYLLTDRRVLRVSGIFRQVVIEAPLGKVQSVTLYRSFRERIFGIGTIVFSTAAAGGGAGEFSWFMAPRPHETIKIVRDTLGKYSK